MVDTKVGEGVVPMLIQCLINFLSLLLP